MDEMPILPEREKTLQSCFCPHGYSTATVGHYHCRYCGHSSRYMKTVMRHEKVHKNFLADEAGASKQRYYSCRQCGFLSRYAKKLWEHEKTKHAKSRPVISKNVSQSRSKTTAVGAGLMVDMTAAKSRVSSKRHDTSAIGMLRLYTLFQKMPSCNIS